MYAFGEIVLVVIGILIALQINNWNEYRKDRAKEKALLIALKNDLRSGLLESAYNYKIENQCAESIDLLIDFMDNKLPYHDSLDFYFRQTVHVPQHDLNLPLYRAINNPKGLDIIESALIRKFLSEDIEKTAHHVNNIDSETGIPSFALPYYFKYFQTYAPKGGGAEKSKPINREAMSKDTTFRNILSLLKRNRKQMYWVGTTFLLVEQQQMINEIAAYLKQMDPSDKLNTQTIELKPFETLLEEDNNLFQTMKAKRDSIIHLMQ